MKYNCNFTITLILDTIKNEGEGDGNLPCQQCKNCYLEFKSVAELEEHLQKRCVKGVLLLFKNRLNWNHELQFFT